MSESCLHKEVKPNPLFRIAAYLIVIQGMFLGIKQLIFSYTVETLYSRSVVSLLSMLIAFGMMVAYCRRKKLGFSALPTAFRLPYLLLSVMAGVFYIVTLFFVGPFSMQKAFMLLHGSFVTPIFEELLFRGAVWNRLNQYFAKEWQTYLLVTTLFALWHIGYAVGIYLWQGGSLLRCMEMKVIVGAIFGLITGAIRYKTKNCYGGILIHGILNAMG
ncbi:MAG: CPBP family intramembrane metalloprotease [Eubacteriales bacterium]|nr:CPBP family intramembrane metalloprotease [Eubacteriales bacterium]